MESYMSMRVNEGNAVRKVKANQKKSRETRGTLKNIVDRFNLKWSSYLEES